MAVRFSGKVWALFASLLAALCAALFVSACGSSGPSNTGQQQIRHVFVITLENENYATTFGANT